jgi:hypothetical protein
MKKNTIVLILFLLSGIVIGGLLGEIASGSEALWWLNYGSEFGLSNPITIDLAVVKVTFGFLFNLTIAAIIGMLASILIYKKVYN